MSEQNTVPVLLKYKIITLYFFKTKFQIDLANENFDS